MSQSSNDTETRNAQAVRKAFANWSAGTGSPFELLAPEATWTIVGKSVVAKTYPNREAFMRDVIAPFNARMRSPLVPTVHQVLADGDTVVVLFDASTVARDGKPYENTYAWFLRMHDGKVVSVTAFFDSIAFNDLWQRVSP
jgi:ketosteroid isomerase-like protein